MPVNESILLVDDEPSILRVAGMMLTRAGYDVTPVSKPEEALELLERQPELQIDLLLVDFVLPGMNGVELVERVRKLRPGLRVLYFSAYAEHEMLRPALVRGVPYLSKPFTSAQLVERVRATLDNSHSDPAGSAP